MKLRFAGMFLILMLLFSSNAVFSDENSGIDTLELINEDTLRLRITFLEQLKAPLNCNISVSDALSGSGFTISFTKSLKELSSASREGILNCTVTGSYQTGRDTSAIGGTYDFVFLKNPDYQNCYEIVLDAIDYSAAEALVQNDNKINSDYTSLEDVKKSCSITRFGICDAIIYAKSGNIKSGYEYSLFSGGSGDDKRLIETPRALFNIRFDTDPNHPYNINKKRQYIITRDIDYTGSIQSSNPNETSYKYDSMKKHDSDGFIPIEELRGSMESASGSMCIKNLRLMLPKAEDKYKERELIQDSEYINICDVGIFRKNYGTVKNLRLDNITSLFVQCDRVGTLCGTNAGTLSGIEVTNSRVRGRFFTGGIAGKDGYYYTDINDEVSGKREYSRLKFGSDNENDISSVRGRMYTGGIIGQINPYKITSQGGSVRAHERTILSGCENNGDVIIEGKNPAYIGGICGDAVGAEIRETSNTRPTHNSGSIRAEHFSGKISYIGGICGSMTAYRGTRLITSTVKNAHNSGDIRINGICQYIGGICGMNENGIISSKPNDIANSSNIILDGGASYIGGIAGCNSGIIGGEDTYARNIGFIHADGDFIGGIAGYNNGSVLYCQSGQDFDIESLYKDGALDKDAFNRLLSGRYVGGIVGANSLDGNVICCETTGGYVFGGEYVGGVIGIQNSGVGVTIQGHKNSADVFARGMAGGICAVNAKAGNLSSLSFTENFDYDSKCRIIDCKNYGAVFVSEKNGGGICGYNAGVIEKCTVDSYDKSEDIIKLYTSGGMREILRGGKCTGGIAGTNGGMIRNIKLKSVFVCGGNYTGGVAGENTIDGNIEGTKLNRGFIKGNDIVGGFIGANFSKTVFDSPLSCRADVEGEDFVGGFIGICSIPREWEININLNPGISTAESSVKGNCFVSGGISCLFSSQSDIPSEYKEKGFDFIYNKYAHQNGENIKGYVNISGSTSSSVKAESIAGGTVGFCGGLRLYISNAVNYGNILVSDYIQTSLFKQYQDAPSVTEQSLAGGIISVASNNVYISQCQNKGSQIALKGYSGGIAAINCGSIRLCRVYSSPGEDQEYFGAVTGLNMGEITECTLTSSISSGNVLGGIASVNEGKISQCETESDIISSGIIAGGIAGINAGELENCTTDMNVSAEKIAGGIAGINTGSIKMVSNSSDKTVYAYDLSGGIAGICRNTSMDSRSGVDYIINNSEVTAEGGSAGGICAVSENSALYGCENFGKVSAKKLSGGIASKNTGIIEKCKNHADADAEDLCGGIAAVNEGRIFMSSSDNGLSKNTVFSAKISGGICALNKGTITGSEVISKEGAVSVTALDTGAAGGVCGINTGILINSQLNKASVSGGGNTILGGVCGINTGTIRNTNGNIMYGECKKQSDKNSSYSGGVCGINSGIISGIYFSGTVYSAYPAAGGIAGINSAAQLKGCPVSISAGDEIIEIFQNSDKAVIENCCFVSAYGSAVRCTKNGSAGGIAGINGENGYILNSKPVYSKNTIEISSASGFSGGIAGENSGIIDMYADEISLSAFPTKEQKPYFTEKNEKVSYKINISLGSKNGGASINGAAGGIAGKNNGVIRNTVSGNTEYGFGTSVSVYSSSQCYGGGICGYNTGCAENVTNNAAVICQNGFGGGICGYNFGGEIAGTCINNGAVFAKKAGHMFGAADKSPASLADFKSRGNVYFDGTKTSVLCGGVLPRD